MVEKTDRLYRNLKDYVTLDELGVDIHFVKENVVLSPNSHSSERFMHGIKVLMARQYVDNLSEEVKKGMLEKAEQGIWPSKAPIGYLNVDGLNGKKVVIPDPEVGPIIKRMFERYVAGNISMEEVGQLAMEEGLPLKREGNYRAVVQYILKNRFYYGDFIYKKKLYKGIHEGLVSRECWDKVQEVRAERKAAKLRKPKNRKSFAFARMIACGHCGCSLVGELKKGKYIYYHCTHYRGKCDEPYVREEVLEEKFTEILRALHFDDEVLDWMRRALRESQADEQRYREDAVKRLRSEYDKLQKRIDTMYVDKLDGRIDAAFFDQKQQEWREEQGRLTDSIAEHQKANESYIAEGIMLMELANRAADLFEKQPASEKRRLLDFVLSNSSWANGELSVEFRQPFGMIADMAAVSATEKVVGMGPDDLCLEKLPEADVGRMRGFVELGAWQRSNLRQSPMMLFFPWKAVTDLPEEPTKRPNPKPSDQKLSHQGIETARRYQSLLDDGTVTTRAELARFLGVSRARVTQVLKRLNEPDGDGEAQRLTG